MRVNSCSGSGRHRPSEEQLHLAVRFAASLPYFPNLGSGTPWRGGTKAQSCAFQSRHTHSPHSSIFRWLFITAALPHRGDDKCRIRALVTRGPVQKQPRTGQNVGSDNGAACRAQGFSQSSNINSSVCVCVCVCHVQYLCVWQWNLLLHLRESALPASVCARLYPVYLLDDITKLVAQTLPNIMSTFSVLFPPSRKSAKTLQKPCTVKIYRQIDPHKVKHQTASRLPLIFAWWIPLFSPLKTQGGDTFVHQSHARYSVKKVLTLMLIFRRRRA